MTLNIALHGKTVDDKCFIVLCSDSRETITDKDDTTHAFDDSEKIIKLNESTALLISGFIEVAMAFVESFIDEYEISEDFDTLLKNFDAHCTKKIKPRYCGIPMNEWPLFEFILAGLDKYGKSRIYIMNSRECFIPRKRDRYGFSGSSILGEYIIKKNYDYDKNDQSKLLKLGIFAMHESKQITDVGGKTKAVIIDEYSYSEQSTEEYIEDIKDYRFFDEGELKGEE